MKKILLRDFCLIHLFLAGLSPLILNAQIVYTDVPDITSSGAYNLDLNNDGTIDFVIQHTSKTVNGSGKCKGQKAINQYIKVSPFNNNLVLDTGTNAKRMLTNETIDGSGLSWKNTSNQSLIGYEWKCTYFCWWDCSYIMLATAIGQWYPQSEDGFLGVRLIYGGHSYFGWLRISVSDQARGFTIKDYAFNSLPEQPILAGQTSDTYLGIPPLSFSNSYFCAGNNIAVPYKISGQLSASNIVTAELSDLTGSFANAVVIGSAVSNVSGKINAVIPGLTPTGYGYRIRVRSSNPATTSSSIPFNTYVQGGLPDPAIVTWDPTNLCQNGSVNIGTTYNYPYGDQCDSYQWRLNGKNISGATSSSYNATVAGDYTCVKSNGAGSVTSNTITVTANPIPATIQASPGPIVCGEAIWLSNTGMIGTYQWKLNGNSILGAIESSYTPTVSGNYSCLVTNTCGSFVSNSIPVSINPPMADATITAAGPTIICSGQVLLNANTGAGLSYQWYKKYSWYETYEIIPGATNSSYAAVAEGNYYVVETGSNGCSRISNSIFVLIGTPPVPTVEPTLATICNGNSVPLHVNYFNLAVGYLPPPYFYQWIKDGVDIAGATTYYYMAKQQGTYTVRASALGGCNSVSESMIITNGCNKQATAARSSKGNNVESPVLNESTLKVSPNPASSMVNISFSLPESGKVTLKLYNINGQQVKTITQGILTKGIHDLTLDTRDLNAGIYILNMQSQGSVETKKLILVK